MSIFMREEDNVLPDYRELEDFPVPESSLDARHVTFEQMRHEFDQIFESDAIPDYEAPEFILKVMENVPYVAQV